MNFKVNRVVTVCDWFLLAIARTLTELETEMANSTKSSETPDASPSPGIEPVMNPENVRAQTSVDESSLHDEIAEMRNLTQSLLAAVKDVRTQNARTELVRGALDEMRADVRTAARAVAMPAPPVAYADQYGREQRGNDCGPCGCVDDACCAFDIKVWQVRAAKPQIEPADMGDIGPFINAMEVQIYFTLDDTGFVWPGLASTMDLRAEGLPGGPGPWVVINRTIQRVMVPRGKTVTKQIRVEVREHDEGLERPIGLKDEIGENVGTISLDCCVERIYPAMPLDVYLDHGGQGGGMVQVAFYAERVCC
jgi:hypothetical protein